MSDVRAVSTTLGYVLSLGIATILITGLIIAGGSYVDSQRKQVVRDELTVVGQQLAADLERADRLVRAGDGPITVNLTERFANSITGASYRVSLDGSESAVVLNTTRPDVTVQVGVTTVTDLRDSSVLGGRLQIRYDDGADRLEVRDV